MSYAEFWYGDPWLARTYRNVYIARRKEENMRDWLLGAYVYNAVATAMANAFRKKGTRPVNYLEEPFQIFPLTAEEAKARQAKAAAQADAAFRTMIARQRAHKAAQEKKNAETNNPNT